ncbi:hypothetical protein SmJEL517_g00136 [Synchytrium microbalum]|uniref:J domain-containing protein n=1 Tax=Synchytrium microbalum TaxID=1806994 RepID=A0A507CK84_9FUNG|nr:uncharacterized protein SmJEL517_g00136 [Synchytrium microbalum]TPX38305.1 hypothetical protein SmJEL517_g00136 [Synchytrium microbalum]
MASSSSDPTSPLRGPPQADYYTILGIERDANQDAIKKGYRKMALRYHPDKTGSDPNSAERFQRIVKAYEILSDEKKRQIYDKYGEQGITMWDQFGEMAPFLDPDILIAINWFFALGTFILALLILFPALISVRADNRNTWSYTALFTPLFFIDASILFCLYGMSSGDDEDSDNDHESDNASYQENRDTRERKRNQAKKGKKRARAADRALRVSYWLLFTIFHILIAIRLDGFITCSWALVFIPWFLMESAHFLEGLRQVREKFIIGMFEPLSNGAAHNQDEEGGPMTARPLSMREKFAQIIQGFWPWGLRVAQAILLIVQFDLLSAVPVVAAMDWRTVFIPTFLYAFFQVGSIIYDTMTGPPPMMPNGAPAPGGIKDKLAAIGAKLVFFSVFAILFYTFIGLLIQRLMNPDPFPTTPVIFIPIFIVLSFLFCCVCCCLPMGVRSMTAAVEQEMNQQRNQETSLGTIVPIDHRIAA